MRVRAVTAMAGNARAAPSSARTWSTVAPRHDEVDKENVRTAGLQGIERRGRGADGDDLAVGVPNDDLHELPRIGLVLDEKHTDPVERGKRVEVAGTHRSAHCNVQSTRHRDRRGRWLADGARAD